MGGILGLKLQAGSTCRTPTGKGVCPSGRRSESRGLSCNDTTAIEVCALASQKPCEEPAGQRFIRNDGTERSNSIPLILGSSGRGV